VHFFLLKRDFGYCYHRIRCVLPKPHLTDVTLLPCLFRPGAYELGATVKDIMRLLIFTDIADVIIMSGSSPGWTLQHVIPDGN
jgi:hypothetical protein